MNNYNFIKYKPSEERFKIIHWIKESIRFIFQKAYLYVYVLSLCLPLSVSHDTELAQYTQGDPLLTVER